MNSVFHPLTLVTFFPLLGVVILLFLKNEQKSAARWTALITSLITFAISIAVLAQFNAEDPYLQMVVKVPWIKVAGWTIYYYLGVDGLSILLLLLTTLLTPIAILSTWRSIDERVRDFMIFFLLLEIGMVGVFLAQDLFLFYVFWEFTLVPMYFLIGVWGGANRIYAAVKFFLYTMAGSVLMLLAILWLGIEMGTFEVPELIAMNSIPADLQIWLFLAFAAAFAIKVPMWPLHSWLPDAHVEAPTAGSVILAGVVVPRSRVPVRTSAYQGYGPVWWSVESNAGLCGDDDCSGTLFDGTTRFERIYWRVQYPVGCLGVWSRRRFRICYVCRFCSTGRDPGGGLSTSDDPKAVSGTIE
jgi:NADH-quinone oxidoreductase subunit M